MSSFISDFTGKDLLTAWKRDSRNVSGEVSFRDWKIEYIVNGDIVRTEYQEANSAIYTFSEMVKDQTTNTPDREVTVKVYERDTWLRVSEAATAVCTNDRPPRPAFTITSAFDGIWIEIVPVDDADLEGYMIFRGATAGFTPSSSNRIYKGKDTVFFDTTAVQGSTYYYKVAAYDAFNSAIADLDITGALLGTVVEPLKNYEYLFRNVVITPNTPSANQIRVSAGACIRTTDGTASETQQFSGQTFTYSGRKVYIYYDWSDNEVKSSENLYTAQGQKDRQIIGTYSGGTSYHDGTNAPIIDGNNIIAGTITAREITAGQAVITDTLQVANSVITTAHIQDATITNAKIVGLNASKITAGTIDAGRIGADSIGTNKLRADAVTSDKIKAGAIESKHISVDSLNGNRIATDSLNADRIKANSITAREIQTGGITAELLVTDQAIINHSAQIKELTVDTLHIKDGAIGFGDQNYLVQSGIHLKTQEWTRLAHFMIPENVSGWIVVTTGVTFDYDDGADADWRISRYRNGNRKDGAKFTHSLHDEEQRSITFGARLEVQGGDIVALIGKRTSSGDIEHHVSWISGMGVQK